MPGFKSVSRILTLNVLVLSLGCGTDSLNPHTTTGTVNPQVSSAGVSNATNTGTNSASQNSSTNPAVGAVPSPSSAAPTTVPSGTPVATTPGSSTSGASQSTVWPVLTVVQPLSSASGTWAPVTDSELFAQTGPAVADVVQNNEGNCQDLSVMGDMAAEVPETLTTNIKQVGVTSDGVAVYSVKLWLVKAGWQETNVDAKLMQTSDGVFSQDSLAIDTSNGKRILWPVLYTKALALVIGGYNYFPDDNPLVYLLAQNTGRLNVSESVDLLETRLSLADTGTAVYAETYSDYTQMRDPDTGKVGLNPSVQMIQSGVLWACYEDNDSTCVVQNHAYSVLSYSNGIVTLRNPWNFNIGNSDNGTTGVEANGFIRMTLDHFRILFQDTVAPDGISSVVP